MRRKRGWRLVLQLLSSAELLRLAGERRTLARSATRCRGYVMTMAYGHLVRDSEDSIRARLDARAAQSGAKVASEGQ